MSVSLSLILSCSKHTGVRRQERPVQIVDCVPPYCLLLATRGPVCWAEASWQTLCVLSICRSATDGDGSSCRGDQPYTEARKLHRHGKRPPEDHNLWRAVVVGVRKPHSGWTRVPHGRFSVVRRLRNRHLCEPRIDECLEVQNGSDARESQRSEQQRPWDTTRILMPSWRIRGN